MSLPISQFKLNVTPISSNIFLLFLTIFFSSLNSGIPKVNKPPISDCFSKTSHLTPALIKTSAQARPAGPEPTIATLFLVHLLFSKLGFQPNSNALSVIYFSMFPMLTAP